MTPALVFKQDWIWPYSIYVYQDHDEDCRLDSYDASRERILYGTV